MIGGNESNLVSALRPRYPNLVSLGPRHHAIQGLRRTMPLVSFDNATQTERMIATTMKCLSCQASYETRDSGTCKECYEEANETEEDRKREIEDLKAKVAFLRFWSPFDPQHLSRPNGPCFTDVVLVASSDDGSSSGPPIPVPAHKAVLVSNSF